MHYAAQYADLRKSLSTNKLYQGIVSPTKTNVLTLKECVYERGGWCKKHLQKGQKGLRVFRTLCKLSTGLCGYKTVRRVTYKCVPGLFDGDRRLPSTTVDELGLSVKLGNSVGTLGNFTNYRGVQQEPELKRLGDSLSSLEPRQPEKRARL